MTDQKLAKLSPHPSRLTWRKAAPYALAAAVVGVVVVIATFAAGTPIAFEAESGTLASGAAVASVTGQSGTGAVKFASTAATPAPTVAPAPGSKVAIIGDSLTYQDAGGQGAVSAAFEAAGWPPNATWFYGVVGKAINDPDSTGKTTVQNIAAARAAIGEPDVWVIALGTNDALSFASAAQIGASIQAVLTALGANAKVVWVNTAGNPDDNFSTLNGPVNSAIAAAVNARPRTLLADWSGYILPISHSGYWIDRVHMSGTGYDIRNQFVATSSVEALRMVP